MQENDETMTARSLCSTAKKNKTESIIRKSLCLNLLIYYTLGTRKIIFVL